MYKYLISVIMPTYNSERTLEESLKSIRGQHFDQNQVEILILDGGSTDNTVNIAKQYGARILENERRLPEFAKQKGFLCAEGKYGIFIDSDESFVNMDSFRRRIDVLKKNTDIKNVVSTGQICQRGENAVTRYANYIGDPFSNFVYRFNGYNRIEDLTRDYKCKKEENGFYIDLSECDYLPLFDALGNMFEIEAARRIYKESGENMSFAANIFSNMTSFTKKAFVMNNDFVIHRPYLSNKGYINKLTWRVKNNLFQNEGVGFSERSKSVKKLQMRKILYIPYCLFVIPVIFDSLRISIKNRSVLFMMHIFYSEYVFVCIGWYVFLKIIKYPINIGQSYGK